jgi:hypothetical protein
MVYYYYYYWLHDVIMIIIIAQRIGNEMRFIVYKLSFFFTADVTMRTAYMLICCAQRPTLVNLYYQPKN